jgi:hypothetical protein
MTAVHPNRFASPDELREIGTTSVLLGVGAGVSPEIEMTTRDDIEIGT